LKQRFISDNLIGSIENEIESHLQIEFDINELREFFVPRTRIREIGACQSALDFERTFFTKRVIYWMHLFALLGAEEP